MVDSSKACKSLRIIKSLESAIIANVFSTLGNKRLEDIQKNVDSITEEIKRKTDRESRDRWGIKLRVLELRI